MPVLSIRAFLITVIAIMGMTLVLLAGTSMLSDLDRQAKAQHVVALTKISQTLLPAFVSARIERGTQIPALLGAAPANDAAWQRLVINRQITDVQVAASIAALKQVSLADAASLAGQLAESHDMLIKLRPIVDAAIRLPLNARDPELLAQYRLVAGQYIDTLVKATDQVEGALKLFDPQIDQLLSIKRAAWAVRSFSGLAAIQIENAAAQDRGWTMAETTTFAENRGRAAQAWSIVTEVGARPDIPVNLHAAIAAAKEVAASPAAREQQAVIDRLSLGQKADRPVAELQKLNTDLLDYVITVLKISMGAMVTQATIYSMAAQWHLVISGGILLAVIALTGFGIFVVHHRVGAPIRRITELMRRLADLETDVEIGISSRRDEIGEMTQALFVFRRAVEERSRRQKEREMQQFLATMIDAMPVNISFKDTDLRYLYVNRARRRFIQHNHEMIGKKLSEVATESLASAVEEIDRRILAGGEAEHFEQVWISPDGHPAMIWSLKTPFRDQDGQIRGVITCGVDITRLKETEAQLVAQRETAENANRSKSAFLANMSHELRTPLNAIIGFAEVLATGYLGRLNEQQTDYAICIRQSGEHLLGVVNDLLDLSHLESGKQHLQILTCPFDRIAIAALSMVRPQADKVGIRLTFAPTNLHLHADERALTQILVNLLSNAVKFSPKNSDVILQAYATDTDVRIEIIDNGIGMTQEQRDAILTAARPSDPYRARPNGGAGLGFPICRRLVEMHHGHLDINSLPGRGSTVSILLPA